MRLARIVSGLIVCAALAAATSSAAAAPLYPDLRMWGPSEFHLTTESVNEAQHRVLRFTARIANLGDGAFEVQRVPRASGTADLVQRIYESPAGFSDVRLGMAVFDPLDFNFVVPDLARYELWTERGFKRAAGSGFRRGQPLVVKDNVAYCVTDTEPTRDDTVNVPVYASCTKFVTGISAGWVNAEFWTGDAQGFDLGPTGLPDGDYVVRAVVDPYNHLHESAAKSDPAREGEVPNSAASHIRIVNGELAGVEPIFG